MVDFKAREAVYDDIPYMVLMGREMHAESQFFRDTEFDRDVLAMNIVQYICHEKNNCWVLEVDGAIVGALLAHCFSPPMTNDLMAQDDTVFIKKEYRGKGGVRPLIEAYIGWAIEHVKEPKYITIGVYAGINNKLAVSAFEKLGFVETSTVMSYVGNAHVRRTRSTTTE